MLTLPMDDQTLRALRAINRRFYDRFARQFSATREHPWPGWTRVLTHLEAPVDAPLKVLDVGCGNGRFAAFLAARFPGRFGYVGLDGSAELLQIAGRRLAGYRPPVDLRRVDAFLPGQDPWPTGERFDLIVLFGVMHHVPGADARRAHLERLSALLAPQGLLALSIWLFDRSPRFARLVVPWETYRPIHRRRGLPKLDPDRLEEGDVLLSWAGQAEYPRYCHFPPEPEISRWIEALQPPLIDRFESDGPSGQDNLYLVFRAG